MSRWSSAAPRPQRRSSGRPGRWHSRAPGLYLRARRHYRPWVGSGLLDDAGLELHLAEAVDLAVDVVAVHGIDEPDATHLRADLDGLRAALDLEVADHDHGVAVGEHVADRVTDHRGGVVVGVLAGCPLVGALGAHEQRAHLVGVLARALGARGQGVGHAGHRRWGEERVGRGRVAGARTGARPRHGGWLLTPGVSI